MKKYLLIVALFLMPGAGNSAYSQVQPADAKEPRIALVIGNSAYRDSPLVNPVNDARAIAKTLEQNGFSVTNRENAGLKDMQILLRQFGDQLRKGGVGLFFFAGHGMQIKGRNFLIPVDADIQREDEVAFNALDANAILEKMESAGNRVNIVILDACRNNPFARSFRSGSVGLAQMDAPVGTLVAFATAPGAVASDGSGVHGLYTQHLLEAMTISGAKVEDVFKHVRANVRRDSQGKQIPWESTSLEGDFYFKVAPPAPPVRTASSVGNAQTSAAELAPIVAIKTLALKKGDEWTYQFIDMFSGNKVATFLRKVQKIEGGRVYLVDAKGTTRSITDTELNALQQFKPDGSVDRKYSKPLQYHKLPLQIGDKWTAEFAIERPQGVASRVTTELKALRQERVATPAGVFNTVRVEGASKYRSVDKSGKSGEGMSTVRFWLSPVVGNFVVFEFEQTDWTGKLNRKERTELLSYRRTP